MEMSVNLRGLIPKSGCPKLGEETEEDDGGEQMTTVEEERDIGASKVAGRRFVYEGSMRIRGMLQLPFRQDPNVPAVAIAEVVVAFRSSSLIPASFDRNDSSGDQVLVAVSTSLVSLVLSPHSVGTT